MSEFSYHKGRIGYPDEIVQMMQKFYSSLSEKDRRRYAAIEASKLGYGGISYISRVLGCSRETIKSGLRQLEQLSVSDLCSTSIRRQGAGRKPMIQSVRGLESAFNSIIDRYNPQYSQKNKISQQKVADLLEEQGFKVSKTVIKKLMRNYEVDH